MKVHTFIFALATAGLATTAFAAQPKVTYDRFKQQTSVTVSEDQNHKTGDVNTSTFGQIVLTSDLKAGDKDPTIGIGFIFARNHWVYLNCHETNFLVDGKPWQPASITFSNQMEKSAAVEVVQVVLTRKQLDELAAAQRVEYRICRDEFVMDNAMMQNFKDFGPAFDQALKGESTVAPPAESTP